MRHSLIIQLILLLNIANHSLVNCDNAHRKNTPCLNNIISNLSNSIPKQAPDGMYPLWIDTRYLVAQNDLNVFAVHNFIIDNFTLYFEGNCLPDDPYACIYPGLDYMYRRKVKDQLAVFNIYLYAFIEMAAISMCLAAIFLGLCYLFLATR
ncbi:uncharacterized protein LOC142352945 [Convolutriloba macropyga]|uniref:uncharacterized protein LOC142352945 n=1 Tax=Convolutriloba macropyga TaxID=536237 RepID=UPI003F51C33E